MMIKQIIYCTNQHDIDFNEEAIHDRGLSYRLKKLNDSEKYIAELTVYIPEDWYKQDNAIERLFHTGGANSQD